MSELVRITLSQGAEARDVHLRACLDHADDVADLADADVLYFDRVVGASEVAGRLAEYPGCAVCAGTAADGTLLLAVRAGCGGEQVELLASVLHALLAGGVGQVETTRAAAAGSMTVG
jgi:hypothetical protein